MHLSRIELIFVERRPDPEKPHLDPPWRTVGPNEDQFRSFPLFEIVSKEDRAPAQGAKEFERAWKEGRPFFPDGEVSPNLPIGACQCRTTTNTCFLPSFGLSVSDVPIA